MGKHEELVGAVAIIGMAGRFPGARDTSELWKKLKSGAECITYFSADELEVSDAARRARETNYVKARSVLDDADLFDAEFFGIFPKEAELIDPQQRLFLETAWEALENAGYDPLATTQPVGVFAGASMNTYFLSGLCSDPVFLREFVESYQVGNYHVLVSTSPDFLATRVAYKLNLRGPAITLQCGCSTSLFAVHQACQSLLSYNCDMALAGGVSVSFPQKRGYYYAPDGMVSPDGHCRTFDERAQGTVFGSGVAAVLLKRYEEAVKDRDHIYAVIRGSAANNDGSAKVGYAAPSVEGQAEVIALAHAVSGINPETISYIEAHGTGTPLGDPIEIAALTKAFRLRTQAKHFCAVGTAKTNLGHLDIAAGVTGLIKTALSLKHGWLPPVLHFERPNPKIDFESSPFFVNDKLREWKTGKNPRRAGVSAFGVGGTNVHAVLEEAPAVEKSSGSRASELLLLSARSETALKAASDALGAHLKDHPELNLADAAYTLATGRHGFDLRRAVVGKNAADASATLLAPAVGRSAQGKRAGSKPKIAFMFPGQGSQYLDMGRGLYESEAVFKEQLDRCAEILTPHLRLDLRQILYPLPPHTEEQRHQLQDTLLAQPAIFSVEYSLARQWMHWGVKPDFMVGHSVGEFVAACLSGVLSLEDALVLIAARGRMMHDLPRGEMLAVRAPLAEITPLLGNEISVAAMNAPALNVVSGPSSAVECLEQTLKSKNVMCRRLHTSHAFHSAMMDPIVAPFTELTRKAPLSAPGIPYLSGVSGKMVTVEEATSPQYWARHFREPVRFSKMVEEASAAGSVLWLEVGPGNSLSTLVRQNPAAKESVDVVPSLPDSERAVPDREAMLLALGHLWIAGIEPDWNAIYGDQPRYRVPLPTYRFERKRFWLKRPNQAETSLSRATVASTADLPLQAPAIVNTGISNMTPNPPTADRRSRLRDKLIKMFADMAGMTAASFDTGASFLELGFDSLFLTQVTQELQTEFKVKLTFRQLLEQQSSIDALAQYIDSAAGPDVLPASVIAAPASAIQSPPLAGLPSSPEASVERLFQAQMQQMSQLMAQQLAALRAVTSGSVGEPAPFAAAAAPSATPSGISQANALKSGSFTTADAAVSAESEAQKFKPFGPYKPVQRGTTGSLTPKQEKYLADVSANYIRRTKKSKEYTQRYRKPFADPRVASGFRSQWKEMVYPIVTERSEGSKLYDIDGNEYVDILNGFGPIFFGHAPKFVVKAVQEQLQKGFEIGPQAPLAGVVAQQICEFVGMDRATFCNTGSEAVMAAMRVARTVTGRNKIVTFAGDYHGTFDEVLVRGVRKDGDWAAAPIAPGIPKQKAENIVVLEYGTAESLAWIRSHANDLAAVLVEPVQSRHPSLQPREFCKEVRRITEASGAALIFDEVVTGFRTHPGGVQALWGIRADMATYGKVIGGGLPIGVLAGSARFMDALDGGAWQYGDDSYPSVGVTFFAGTFVRHPLAMAATHAVLNHLKEEGPQLQERLAEKTSRMVAELNAFLESRQAPTRIEHFSSIFYFSFPPDLRFASLFHYHMRAKGVHILEGFPCFLTTAHSDKDIAIVVKAFKESILEMQAGGALPALEDVASAQPAISVTTATGVAEAPLTEAQIEILLSAQLGEAASCAYNESFTLKMNGDLNRQALEGALNEIVARHDILRATFDPQTFKMRFAPKRTLEFPYLDLSGEEQDSRDARLKELISREAALPFDLEHGPVWRAQLVRLDKSAHWLIVTSHHMVCDGWSTNVILDELAKMYSAKSAGRSAELSAPLQFGEYSRILAKEIEKELAETEHYWLKQFEQPVTVLNLPTDRPHPAMKSFAGASYRKEIGLELYKKVRTAGARNGCTPFATLLTTFYALVARLTNQNDVVVGIPAAGQSLLAGKTLVGHCVNLLPLRALLDNEKPFADLLAQVKTTLLDAYEHQNYTYGTLVRKLRLPRNSSRLPLLELQFNLERVGTTAHFQGLSFEVDPNPKRFANFDIFFNVRESDRGLVIDCDYNTDILDESTIARWMTYYETLLGAVAENPKEEIGQLRLVPEEERRKVLQDWNQTNADFPKDKSLHQLIEQQAMASPDMVALEFQDEQLSYAELNQRANRLAKYLAVAGVGPGSLVALFMERSSEMIVGLLGILKSGAAYIPLDPTYPPERLAYVLEQTAAPVVVTQEKLLLPLGETTARVICLDRDWPLISKADGKNLPTKVSSEDLAYVIFTSGSAGKPKGVEVSHGSVVNLLWAMRSTPGMTAKDIMLAVTTLSFDISGLELLLPLVVGGKLVVVSRELASNGLQLADKIQSTNATIMQATPVSWRLLIESGWKGKPDLKALVGGEAVPRELVNQLVERAASVWNMYGPTETTIWSSTLKLQKASGTVPLGGPIANTQFYVLDNNLSPAPIGVPGELHIGGGGVARGYHKRPELTAERFIPSPFIKGGRLYKTGDLARYRPNGTLEFLGRLDDQVKLRGFRIELGEIEGVLAKVPGVRECSVALREDIPGDKRLVAYLVATGENRLPKTGDIRPILLTHLPDYMVPSTFVELPSLPLTPNGKVDRKALPAPDWSRSSKEYVAPQSDVEKKLASIWAEVLHLEKVGINDQIFELGADSLHVFQITTRANQAGIRMSARQLLQHRTIAGVIAEISKNGDAPVAPMIQAVARDKYRVKRTNV